MKIWILHSTFSNFIFNFLTVNIFQIEKLRMDPSTEISLIFPNGSNTYRTIETDGSIKQHRSELRRNLKIIGIAMPRFKTFSNFEKVKVSFKVER